MQQWTGTWSAGAGGRALQSASFLNDAFQQLDEVLKRKAEAQAQQPPPPPTQELKASQQMIQRWLVIFARDHPADICEKLMAAAMEHSATAVPARSLPKQQLPTKSDEHDSRSELRGDGSIDYFLLDSLRRVLAAAAADESGAALRAVCEQLRSAEKGGGDHSGRDPAQPGLLDFCYSRISVVYSAPIRHVASECVGLLSAARLKPVVEMFLASLARVTSDRDEREFVPSMRATRLLQLSTHSAEQAAASLAYLKALASSMARVSRGVLRAEVCAALVEALPRLMAPADDDRRGEWAEYCSGSAAREWWRAYAEVYSHMLRWARGKGAHAPFCYEAMVPMLALASRPDAGDGGDAFADKARREQLLLLSPPRSSATRGRVPPLAATFVASLPVAFLRADLGSGARESPIRRLCQEVLPRRHLPDASEGEHVLRLLLALAAAQPDAAYALQLVRDSLHPLARHAPPSARCSCSSSLKSARPSPPRSPTPPSATRCAPSSSRCSTRPTTTPPTARRSRRRSRASPTCGRAVGERDVLELQRVAQLVESDVRELHHAACICLNSLASADGLHLALPALAALCRAPPPLRRIARPTAPARPLRLRLSRQERDRCSPPPSPKPARATPAAGQRRRRGTRSVCTWRRRPSRGSSTPPPRW